MQPMICYVVLISQMKVVEMKMISECPIVAKGQLIMESLVSELGVVYRRANKEAAN